MCEQPEFTREAWRTCSGRSPFRCAECRGEIVKGERYFLLTGKWNGEMETHRFHTLCHEISEGQRTAFHDAGVAWDEMPAIGEMVEAAAEDAGNIDDFPAYWPAGVYISQKALFANVRSKGK